VDERDQAPETTRDMKHAGERETGGRDEEKHLSEGATPGQVGALDGAAAAGSAAAQGTPRDDDGSIPTTGPDPRFGPD
jgi:hypothetical protein